MDYVKFITDNQEEIPNLIESVVSTAYGTDDGAQKVTRVLKAAPSLHIFVRGVDTMVRVAVKEVAVDIMKQLLDHNKETKDGDKEARQMYLNSVMSKLGPAPFRAAVIDPGENYFANTRAHDNQRADEEVLPDVLGPSQLSLSA